MSSNHYQFTDDTSQGGAGCGLLCSTHHTAGTSCSMLTCPTALRLLLSPGPDRALFLPGGLLDRNDLPDYLDGTLAGE
jgi:hypothetical protein